MSREYWVYSPKQKKGKPTEKDKKELENFFAPLIEQFKRQYIKPEPDKYYVYTSEIYCKWYQHFFYLCEKNITDSPNNLAKEYEYKFVRLKFNGNNKFDFSYFRHTGQWHLVADDLTKEECLEMITGNPVFHPLG